MSNARNIAVAAEALDKEGLQYLWSKIKATFRSKTEPAWGMNMCYVMPAQVEPTIGTEIEVAQHAFIEPPVVGSLLFGIVIYQDKWYLTKGTTGLFNDNNSSYKVAWDIIKEVGSGNLAEVSWDDISNKPDLVLQSAFDAFKTENEAALAARPTTNDMNTAISTAVSSVYKYKGTVATFEDLPTQNPGDESTYVPVNGDVYNVESDDMNYAWVAAESETGGGHWDPLGGSFSITPISNAEIDAIVNGTTGA